MISRNISVVITTKDRPQFLQEALLSLSKQTTLPGEIVIVDDASNRGVRSDELEAIQSLGVPVRLLRTKFTVGASRARNIAILETTKDFIAFLDDDDTFRPEKIATIEEVIEHDKSVGLIYHKANVKLINENMQYETKYRKGRSSNLKEIVISNYIGGCSLVVCKKSLLLKAGLFDEDLPACEDWDLWIRCIQSGGKEVFVDQVLTDYSCVSGAMSLSQNFNKNTVAKLRLRQKYEKIINSFSQFENSRYMEYCKADDLHRYLLANRYICSLKCALELFNTRRSVMNFIKLFVVLCGTRNALRFRCLL